MAYILISRSSPSARYLDVQTNPGDNEGDPDIGKIMVYGELPPDHHPVLDEETDLLAYINSKETAPHMVEADLARRILGWNIP